MDHIDYSGSKPRVRVYNKRPAPLVINPTGVHMSVGQFVTLIVTMLVTLFIVIGYIHDDTLRVTARRCVNEGHFVVDNHMYTCEELNK